MPAVPLAACPSRPPALCPVPGRWCAGPDQGAQQACNTVSCSGPVPMPTLAWPQAETRAPARPAPHRRVGRGDGPQPRPTGLPPRCGPSQPPQGTPHTELDRPRTRAICGKDQIRTPKHLCDRASLYRPLGSLPPVVGPRSHPGPRPLGWGGCWGSGLRALDGTPRRRTPLPGARLDQADGPRLRPVLRRVPSVPARGGLAVKSGRVVRHAAPAAGLGGWPALGCLARLGVGAA